MEVCRYLEREKHNENEIKQNLRRSKRIKNKNSAMIVIDEEMSKNVEQAKIPVSGKMEKDNGWRNWMHKQIQSVGCNVSSEG